MASIKKIRNHRLLAIFSPFFWMNLLDERALSVHCGGQQSADPDDVCPYLSGGFNEHDDGNVYSKVIDPKSASVISLPP